MFLSFWGTGKRKTFCESRNHQCEWHTKKPCWKISLHIFQVRGFLLKGRFLQGVILLRLRRESRREIEKSEFVLKSCAGIGWARHVTYIEMDQVCCVIKGKAVQWVRDGLFNANASPDNFGKLAREGGGRQEKDVDQVVNKLFFAPDKCWKWWRALVRVKRASGCCRPKCHHASRSLWQAYPTSMNLPRQHHQSRLITSPAARSLPREERRAGQAWRAEQGRTRPRSGASSRWST